MFKRKRGIEFRAVYDKFGPSSVVECRWPDGHYEVIRGCADWVSDPGKRAELVRLAEAHRRASS